MTRQLENDGTEHVYKIQITDQPPRYLGTIIGDFFHNLCSALDSIVYDLSLKQTPGSLRSKKRRPAFPSHQTNIASKHRWDRSPVRSPGRV